MLIVKINAKTYVEILYYFIEPTISLNSNKLHTQHCRNYFAQIGLCKPSLMTWCNLILTGNVPSYPNPNRGLVYPNPNGQRPKLS